MTTHAADPGFDAPSHGEPAKRSGASGVDRHAGERGQIVPIVLFGAVPLILLASFGMTAGYWRYEQRLAQTAADSAAFAGAVHLQSLGTSAAGGGTAPPGVYRFANVDSTANGFQGAPNNGGWNGNIRLQIISPPTSGPYTGDTSAVQAWVQKRVGIFFGAQIATVRAGAVALTSPPGDCLYALSTQTSSSLPVEPVMQMNRNVFVDMPTCAMHVNGNIQDSGPGNGTIDAKAISYAQAPDNGFSPTYVTAQPVISGPVADPCPTIPGCAALAASPPSAAGCVSGNFFPGNPAVIAAGTYCGQAHFNGPGVFTLGPGLHVFEDGFSVNQSATINGSGVTIVSLLPTGYMRTAAGSFNVTAPTTGPYAGVLMYQASVNNPTGAIDFNAQTVLNTTGLIYSKVGSIFIDSNTATVGQLVGDKIIFNGGGGTHLKFVPTLGGAVKLVE